MLFFNSFESNFIFYFSLVCILLLIDIGWMIKRFIWPFVRDPMARLGGVIKAKIVVPVLQWSQENIGIHFVRLKARLI